MSGPRLHSRRILTVVLGCLLVLGTLGAQPALARRSPTDTLVAIVNKAREAVGAMRLPVDRDLSREAKSHSKLMARTRRLDPPQSGEAAENVIVASTPARLARAALRLPEIARNLLAPQWDGVGVGIVRGTRGTYWATFLFRRNVQPGPTSPPPVSVPSSPIPLPPPPPPGASVSSPPASIVSNCTLPVEDQLMAWLDTVPDNSVVQFPPGACYGLDDTITMEDRVGLTIDGNGSTFKALTPGTGNRDNWRIEGGTNITLKNMIVRGANPSAGVNDNA